MSNKNKYGLILFFLILLSAYGIGILFSQLILAMVVLLGFEFICLLVIFLLIITRT